MNRNDLITIAQRLREYVGNPHHVDPMSDAFKMLIGEASEALSQASQPQGEPVAVKLPSRDDSLGTAENDMYANGWRHGWNAYEHAVRQLGPLYAEQPAPVAVVPEPTYRLLGDGDIIQEGDETLNDDTATWGKQPPGIFLGMPYNRRVMLPVRRAISA